MVGGKEARDVAAFAAAVNPHDGIRLDAAALKPKEAHRSCPRHLLGLPESKAQPKEEASNGEMAAVYGDRFSSEKGLWRC